jgi:hypothetical protein
VTRAITRALFVVLPVLLWACSSSDDATTDADAAPDVGDAAPDETAPPDVADEGREGDTADDGEVVEPPCPGCPAAHAAIVEGLGLVEFELSMSRVEADRETYVPLVWGSYAATGGDRRGLAGTLPAPGWLGMPGAGRVVVWAGHEGAWGPAGDGLADNDAFRERLLAWLLGDGTRVGFAAGHGEWLQADGCSPELAARLAARGATIGPVAGALDAAALAGQDVVVLGNPWNELTDAELAALEGWVRDGGGLLVLGLGWSWPMYHADPAGEQYPVNRLGERLGFRVQDGSIYDPEAPSGTPEQPGYQVRPLVDYQPRELVVLRAAETDVGAVKALAAAEPDGLYVIEGAHMGLQLPTRDWALLDDPAGALAALDRLYEAELDLVGGVHPPFGGAVVWIVSVDDPDAAWWMHSGNPIVYLAEAARSELIPRFNAEGHPGWGIAHEQGHNMHGESCGNLFVAEVTGEVWVNVFAVWSFRQNGWDWASQMGAGLFDAGHAYHAQAVPDFAELAADPFILLGCFDLLWTRYGWDGMREFLTRAAGEATGGATAGDDAARTAYFIEGLSAAYEVDFAPLFAHWGFAVSDATRAVTAAWPASDIPW